MPLRSRCVMLPPEVRAWLDSELRRRHHSGFHELSALLAERGFEIGKSAVHKYSIGLRRRDGLPLRGSGLDCRSIRETDPPPAPAPPPAPPTAGDQRAAVKRWLASGRPLNARIAIDELGIYRLAAVIERIRRIDGWPIKTIKAPGSGFASYRLPPDYNPFNSEKRHHETDRHP
jgi:hypothetical protein